MMALCDYRCKPFTRATNARTRCMVDEFRLGEYGPIVVGRGGSAREGSRPHTFTM
jgi:hypothetical protein